MTLESAAQIYQSKKYSIKVLYISIIQVTLSAIHLSVCRITESKRG